MATSIISFPEEYFLILQNCLDGLLYEEQTIDSVLLSYPRLRDQLRPLLEAAIWLNSKKIVLNPRPEFIPVSKNHVVNNLKMWNRTFPEVKKMRRRKSRLVIWKNAFFFSIIGPLLASFLK
jgi:hypothetical protein